MKKKIYRLIEKGQHGHWINGSFDNFILWLIVLSVISIILESITEINNTYGLYIHWFNVFTIIIFSGEYLMRIYISDLTHPSNSRIKSAFKFIFSTYGLIDLLAILPFYLPMFIKMDLRFLRALRLTRFLRILKVNRYNNSLNLIADVVKEKRSELAVTGFVTFLVLLIASFLMYYIEGDEPYGSFDSVPASFWWAVSTLTTVGYGDVYPTTALGKVISAIIALMGIGLVALPTGILGAGFVNKIDKQRQKDQNNKCPHCGKDINKEDNISE